MRRGDNVDFCLGALEQAACNLLGRPWVAELDDVALASAVTKRAVSVHLLERAAEEILMENGEPGDMALDDLRAALQEVKKRYKRREHENP